MPLKAPPLNVTLRTVVMIAVLFPFAVNAIGLYLGC